MSRKGKHSLAEKVSLVRRCMAGELSICAAGRLAGVGETTVRRWIVRYETEGAEGFLLQERNRVYSPELKQMAVEEYLSGAGSCIRRLPAAAGAELNGSSAASAAAT